MTILSEETPKAEVKLPEKVRKNRGKIAAILGTIAGVVAGDQGLVQGLVKVLGELFK